MHQLENAEHYGGEPEQVANWVWHRIGHEQVDTYLDKPSPGITYANSQDSGNIPSPTQQASKQASTCMCSMQSFVYHSAATQISLNFYLLYTTSFITLEEIKNCKSLLSYSYFIGGSVQEEVC